MEVGQKQRDLDALFEDLTGFSLIKLLRSFRAGFYMKNGQVAEAVRTQAWDNIISPIRFLLSSLAFIATVHALVETLLLREYRGFFFHQIPLTSEIVLAGLIGGLVISVIMSSLFFFRRRIDPSTLGFFDSCLKTFQITLYALASIFTFNALNTFDSDLSLYLTNGTGSGSVVMDWLYPSIQILIALITLWIVFGSLPFGLAQLHKSTYKTMFLIIFVMAFGSFTIFASIS